MRIVVDLSICVGHGRCYALAPALFAADDEGHAVQLAVEAPPEAQEAARAAAANCPEGAITIE